MKKKEAEQNAVAAEEQKELTPEEQQAARKAKFLKEIREWVVALVVALVVVLFIRTFLFTIIRVDGHSMDYTLADGERMFVTILDKKLFGVERDDVVICHFPSRGRTYFVKRVRGVPGDVVERKNNVTYINGEAIDPENALKSLILYPDGHPDDYGPYTLGEDEYFVVGDNVYNSHDSRDWNDSDPSGDVGPITGDMIVGRARFVFWPLSEIRSID